MLDSRDTNKKKCFRTTGCSRFDYFLWKISRVQQTRPVVLSFVIIHYCQHDGVSTTNDCVSHVVNSRVLGPRETLGTIRWNVIGRNWRRCPEYFPAVYNEYPTGNVLLDVFKDYLSKYYLHTWKICRYVHVSSKRVEKKAFQARGLDHSMF